jgi:hypothetical protein
MLFKAGVVLLVLWLVGLFGPYDLGKIVHTLLLVGLMLLLLSGLKTRDAALDREREQQRGKH